MVQFFIELIEDVLFYAVILLGVGLFVAACLGAGLLYRRIFGLQIWVKFLQRTGYRRKADPGAPVEAQAQAIMAEIFRPEGVVRGPWIRDMEGLTLTYNSWMYREGDGNVTQESWQVELPFDTRIQVQVLERRLAHAGFFSKLASEALGRKRRWGEKLPHELRTGDAPFDGRFLVLSDKAWHVPAFLGDAGVRQALAGLPEACVVVAQKWIVLDDPEGTLRKKYAPLAFTPAQLMEKEPVVHDHAASVLAALARAVRASSAAA